MPITHFVTHFFKATHFYSYSLPFKYQLLLHKRFIKSLNGVISYLGPKQPKWALSRPNFGIFLYFLFVGIFSFWGAGLGPFGPFRAHLYIFFYMLKKNNIIIWVITTVMHAIDTNGSFLRVWLKIAPIFGTSLFFLSVGIVSFWGAFFNQKGKNEPFSIIFLLYVKK